MKTWTIASLFLCLFLLVGGPAVGDTTDGGFTIAILPSAGLPDTPEGKAYDQRLRWIVEHQESRHIVLAIRPGNITRENRVEEWKSATEACTELEAVGVPVLLVPGARDIEREGPMRDMSRFLGAFGPQTSADGSLHATRASVGHGGHSVARFEVDGTWYLVIGLALDPGKEALCWAGARIQEHTDHKVILVTPRYLGDDGEHASVEEGVEGLPQIPGKVIWDELVRRHSNICLVLCEEGGRNAVTIRERASGEVADREALEDPVIEMSLAGGEGAETPRLLHFRPRDNVLRLDGDVNAVDLPMDLTRPTSYRYDRCSDLFYDRSVNTTARRQQRRAALSGDALGNFVVAWEDDSRRAKGDFEIHIRGFHPDGCERFTEGVANAVPWGAQVAPAVDMAPDGSFVVVWEDSRRGGDADIFAAGFDAQGRRVFGDVRVNRDVVGIQRRPSVAVFSDGSFVVAWEDDGDRDHRWDVHAAGFDGYGRRSFAPRLVHGARKGQQLRPAIGAWSRWTSGAFVVAWENDPEGDGTASIMAAGFDPRGQPLFQPLGIQEKPERDGRRPAICVAEDGAFVVAWEARSAEDDACDIRVGGFDGHGKRRFPTRPANVTSAPHHRPDVALRSGGDFVVVWERADVKAGAFDVLGSGFNNEGEVRFSEKLLTATRQGAQRFPRVDVAEAGDFLTTWMDDADGNGMYEIQVNRRSSGGG